MLLLPFSGMDSAGVVAREAAAGVAARALHQQAVRRAVVPAPPGTRRQSGKQRLAVSVAASRGMYWENAVPKTFILFPSKRNVVQNFLRSCS